MTRIVITGATGNLGTSLLDVLAEEGLADSVLGLARRLPDADWPKTDFAAVDVGTDDLEPHLRGADVVVHLAWAIQPSREEERLWRTNVVGTERVLRAAASAGVDAVVLASSVGAYSPGPKDRPVDESWPTHGVGTSSYSRHKAYLERLADIFERDQPDIRVVRVRPGLVLKAGAASEISRLFLGPFVPPTILGRRLIPVVPETDRLRFQVVASHDVGRALAAATTRRVRGAYNLAAPPTLDGAALADVLRARAVPVSEAILRRGASATWRLRLQPTDPGWVDLVLAVPIMDCGRALRDLGWIPDQDGRQALSDLLQGFAEGARGATAPLAARH